MSMAHSRLEEKTTATVSVQMSILYKGLNGARREETRSERDLIVAPPLKSVAAKKGLNVVAQKSEADTHKDAPGRTSPVMARTHQKLRVRYLLPQCSRPLPQSRGCTANLRHKIAKGAEG